MAYNLEEQESIDNLKGWWEKWGTPVMVVIIVVCLGFAGFNGWRWYKHRQTAKASAAYSQLQQAILTHNDKNIKSLSEGLMDQYGSTVFGPLAAFAAARSAMDSGDEKAAEEKLRWVVEKSGREEFEAVARVRLAGLLLDEKKADEALKLLQAFKPKSDAEKSIVNDRLGDVYQTLGRTEDAKKAWTEALAATQKGEPFEQFLQMKLESLPDADEAVPAGAPAAASSSAAASSAASSPAAAAAK
ncbi:tetratricopeptide repeat protein [Mesosutterella sp. OilRF-GAM-744-9]|uniref:Ancillary SecYEG translocon subunit n=1 Tax=Mesosutterella porci TaxID=2915351 RepID=A0ABS9MU00_9BURK|nr:tetratricopeptide repeat protein [Mesosutterella sp. oilRF-744-WT-GAM-9]MCG5031819.1 tetratricopeptide repeat protein [Mesosutterella sp. oilRF-744-WT-GAM-9]